MSKRLSKQEMVHLCRDLVMKDFVKGEVIKLSRGRVSDDVYFLKKGVVKIINLSNEGEEIIKYMVKKGDLFGIMSLMDMQNDDDYGVALEDSIICIIDANYLKKMMEANQNLNNYIFKLWGVRIKKLERNLASLLYKDAKTRIEDFIKDYIMEVGKEEEHYYVAKNLLSNRDIGKLTSTSRQTVNKTLNNLKRRNLIEFDKHIIRMDKGILKSDLTH